MGKNFAVLDIFFMGLYKYPIKIYQERQRSFQFLAKLKVLPWSLTDLSA
jgi:hypothetical protein